MIMNFFIVLIVALIILLCFHTKTFLSPHVIVMIYIAWAAIGRIVYNFGHYDLQRFYMVGFCFCTALLFINKNKQMSVSYKSLGIGILVVIIGIASSLINNRLELGLIELQHFSIIFIISWLLIFEYSKSELLKFIYRLSIIAVSAYLVYFFVGYIAYLTSLSSPLWPADSTNYDVEKFNGIVFSETLAFSFVRFFNHIQTWTLPVLFSAIIFARKSRYKIYLFAAVSLWWALLIQTGGRGTFLAVVTSFVIVSLLFSQNRIQRSAIFLGSLIVGLAAYIVLFYSISEPARSITRRGMSGRMQMWEKAWSMFCENPIFGTGPLSYSIMDNDGLYFAHPHNFYLQTLSEWGLIVLIIFLLVAFTGAYKIIKTVQSTKNKRWKELEIGLVWSFGAAFLHAGLSQMFNSPLSQVFLIFFLAWGLKILYLNKTCQQTVTVKAPALAVISLLMIGAFVFLNRPMIGNSFDHYKDYREKYESYRLYPRIWEQGLNYEKNIDE